jgi:S-adenosylmethionine:tRNA ribosyltransferase-isomerase
VHSSFKYLLDFVENDSTFVFNNTKVIKARLFGHKDSGAKIELLINRPMDNNTFMVYIKGKVHIGTKIIFDNNLVADIIQTNDDGSRIVKFLFEDKLIDFQKLIDITNIIGNIPIPPYLKRDAISDDEIDYQSIFAKYDGSVASATASLHFSDTLYKNIQKKFDIQYITLHIGAGTFKPIEVDDISQHIMHSEYYNIPTTTVDLIQSNKKILAVGTTTTRSIESYIRNNKTTSDTNLFLNLENKPKRVDYLITNFHFPKSTLLMLVSSFIGLDKTKKIYQEAIDKEYRFYSYGDGMIII